MSDGVPDRSVARREVARRGTTINLRVETETRDLIDAAAEAIGKNRTEFMIEAARRHAIDVLLDQRLFRLDPDAFDAFDAALDNPPSPSERLVALMRKKPLWAK
ncbi:DUF1778 domain-containing protein [Methylobacterium aquaticum]|uniref:type II toxin-antitoxin system TacA family antitoxin n=1 Tax=Methylobacterium aquaticum TaxID=270351 RepID=UPI0019326965|nr:DUF1778 domain-containing protein [Methylobacterium aquaticum]QRE75343.1 DUF1778 domain-containing protein [Methylobacterium aquaticum]